MSYAPLTNSKTEHFHLVYLFKKSNKDKQLRQLPRLDVRFIWNYSLLISFWEFSC